MDFLIMGLAAVIIIAALLYFREYIRKYQATQKKLVKRTAGSGSVQCPLCGMILAPGENLVSKVFTTSGQVNDQICYIYGCPHCYPKCQPGIKRSCPVCHKSVAQNQYLLARRFNKTKSGTPHVIVNGCGNCNRH
ncbi:MAG: hypothetical protein K6F15_01610 [Treponema sp.]|nr:hypothetical protein [Treponema sp.]